MPKEGRIPKLFSKFLRVNEDVSPFALSEGEFPLFKNMVLDNPFGRPHIRGGFQELNANEPVNPIITWEDVKSGNGTNYHIAGVTSRLYRSTGGAWTVLKGVATTMLGSWFRHTAYGDDLIFCNGTSPTTADQIFRMTGDDFSTETPLELVKPDITDVIMQREKNFLADAKLDFDAAYHYILVYVSEVGERSNPSLPMTYIGATYDAPRTTGGALSRMLLDNLPIPTDDRVVSKWLFRTEGWNLLDDDDGAIFYLLKKLDVADTEFEDNVADEELDVSEVIIYSRVPDKAHHILQSNNRIFLGNLKFHQKNFFEGHVVCKGAGSDTTPASGIVYEDGMLDNITSTQVSIPRYSEVAYAGGGGGLGGLHADKYYQYMYTYEDINGYESEPAFGQVFLTLGAGGTYRELIISWLGDGGIGVNNYKNNPQLKYRNLYRTVGNAASFTSGAQPFYLVNKKDIQHSEAHSVALVRPSTPYDYADELADVAKDSGTGLGALYAEVNKEAKSSIAWSQADRPSYFLAESIRQIFNDDQDEITGMLDDGNGVLIFKENSIVKLYHTGAPQNWYIRKIWNKFGCDNSFSLIKAGSQIYFQYRKQPYVYVSGGAPNYIGYGKQTFFNNSLITVNSVEANQKWVTWLCDDGTKDYLVIWDTRMQSWYEFDLGAYATTFIGKKKYSTTIGDNEKILLGDKRTYEYIEGDPTEELSGSGVEVSATLQLPRITYDGVTKVKLRDMVANLQRNGSETINLGIVTDSASYSPVAIPSGEDILRLIGWGGKPSSSYFDVTLTGGLEQLDFLRADIRPIRRGVGTI